MKFLKNFMIFSFIIITSSLIIISLLAFQPVKEFKVNTYTEYEQRHPAIAMDKEGNFIITWESWVRHVWNYEVFARMYKRDGQAVGTEFQVNTYTNDDQVDPVVAMDEKGNFIIAWESEEQDGSSCGIFARMYNREGKALGKEFQVNTYTDNHQTGPAIEMDDKGNFIITWTSNGQDGSYGGIYAQRFNRKGKAIGKEFQVNTYTENGQTSPVIGIDEKGNFIITWLSYGQDGDERGIFARRYNRKGKAIGKEFQVNTYTKNDQEKPAIAMYKKGNFIITWESNRQDGDGRGIFARRYNKKGKAIGKEFQVNTYTKVNQEKPAIAMDEKGDFVITWESNWQDDSGDGVYAQGFNKKGKAVGNEFQVPTFYYWDQGHPAIAMDKKGNFVITWQSDKLDGDDYGIFAKMYKK